MSDEVPGFTIPSTDARVHEPGRLMRLATYASVAAAVLLIGAKTVAWGITDSVALLSSLLDSLLDAVASLLNLVAVRHALQPADREHRFGHGKAEPLAGLGQSAFIAGSGLFLLFEGGRRVLRPEPIQGETVGIAVMVLSIVVTIALVTFQRYVIRRTKSVAISADSLHYQGDLLMNSAIIVSLLIVMLFGWHWVDGAFAVGIGLYIMYGAWKIALGSMNLLMDRELPDEDRARIRAIAQEHPEVISVHDIRTRSSGPQNFIQLHLEMDPGLTLLRAHDISDEVVAALKAAYPNSEVIIHQDPAGIEEGIPRA